MNMNEKYILTVIDMQPYWNSAYGNKKLISNVRNEIKKAIRLNNWIIFVKFEGCGPITKGILKAINHYKKRLFISKFNQNGSKEILENINRIKNIKRINNLYFCGVNTDQCVYETIKGIYKKCLDRFNIKVVANACAGTGFLQEKAALNRLRRYYNVEII